MPRVPRLLPLCLISLLASLPWCWAAPASSKSEITRYGVFLNEARIGSLITESREVQVNGKPGVRLEATTEVKLTTLGSTVEQKVHAVMLMLANGKPVRSRTRMESLGRATHIDATYEPSRVVCTITAGDQKSQRIVPIPKGVTLTADPQLTGAPADQALKVGQKHSLHFFEPLTLTIQKVETEVVQQANRTVDGKKAPAFLIRTNNTISGASEMWVSAEGDLLEDRNTGIGLRLVREGVDTGPAVAYQPPKDFALATAVKTAVKVENPRELQRLDVVIRNIADEHLLLSDARQTITNRRKEGEGWTATYQVQVREVPARTLPPAQPDLRAPNLGDATYLDLEHPELRKQARALAAGAADRGAIARRLRAWVKEHMREQNNVGTPRGAAEILKSRDGVCRDYATLFAALARAAGVPTRICSGIVYFDDGFFYHAWVECQLTDGDDGWYPFDPTLDTDFVDATHIKFAQGDPTAMFTAVRLVGSIQAEVRSFRH